ncbi:MAG: hypothetical protein GEU96_07360 [Propionibacteriales bacterium]|nr:hypothetical protein [Propionibacteriales bacterium]
MTTTDRTIGPAGTAARAVIGIAITVVAVATMGVGWWDVAAALVALPAVAVAAALGINAVLGSTATKARARAAWSGTQIAVATVVILTVVVVGTAITFVTPVNGGSIFLYFGLSMLLASARGYDGCEVLALPNLVLRRRDAIWCPLYSPVDRSERVESG